MKKSNDNLLLLGMLFVVSLVIANVVTAKVIDTNITFFGNNVLVPGAVLCYAFTFLITDIVGETWGKEEANKIVKYGFIGQIFSTILIVITGLLPANDIAMQDSYNMLLGQNIMFVIGSLVAYLVSQSCDVYIFHKIRDNIMKKDKTNKNRWIWNNLSTLTSQILDTVIFITIAFGIGYRWLFDSNMLPVLGNMIIGQYLVKSILAILDTPIFYLFTKTTKKNHK